jgi:hypothetical protein
MARSHLAACPSCARHVRTSEETCPFCASALSPAFQAVPAPQAPGTRLARAALFAFGAGTLAMSTACSSSSPPATQSDEAGASQPAYGGSPVYDAGLPNDAGESDTGTIQPVYGAPADAGVPLEDSGSVDSGSDSGVHLGEDGGLIASYGGPPVLDGG